MYTNITDLQNAAPKMEWPYPVNYEKENNYEVDILIIGGGLAGAAAAIEAAGRGATVALVDKGPINYSSPSASSSIWKALPKTMRKPMRSSGHSSVAT